MTQPNPKFEIGQLVWYENDGDDWNGEYKTWQEYGHVTDRKFCVYGTEDFNRGWEYNLHMIEDYNHNGNVIRDRCRENDLHLESETHEQYLEAHRATPEDLEKWQAAKRAKYEVSPGVYDIVNIF